MGITKRKIAMKNLQSTKDRLSILFRTNWIRIHYINKQRFVDVMREQKAQVFLDSGAFSAFHLGAVINIAELLQLYYSQ